MSVIYDDMAGTISVLLQNGKKVMYQIVADTGETLGIPIEDWDNAVERVKEIVNNETYLQELCPDSDISEITSLRLEPTTNY